MNRISRANGRAPGLWLLLTLLPAFAVAQVPVDEHGKSYGASVESLGVAGMGNEDIPRFSHTELQELVGPVALYPDDLLAIVLPAATYPLQLIEAARFLEDLESNPSLEPDENWDDSIVALINYPEIVELLNDDLDWTWRLGEAVVAQQADVVAAVESFRDRAYAAGNLKSDGYQTVSRESGAVSIRPVSDDAIYVPYYEPSRVVVRQSRPVYYYYPEPCPVYYYPYASHHAFNRGYFWGLTTAFSIAWASDRLRVFHHSYHGHPYFGHSYWDRWWYRRPSINVYHNTYVGARPNRVTVNRYYAGDYWRPSRRSGIVRGVDRHAYRPAVPARRHNASLRAPDKRRLTNTYVTPVRSEKRVRSSRLQRQDQRDRIEFRDHPQRPAANKRSVYNRSLANNRPVNNRTVAERRQPSANVVEKRRRTTMPVQREQVQRQRVQRQPVQRNNRQQTTTRQSRAPAPQRRAPAAQSQERKAPAARSDQRQRSQRQQRR